MRIAILGGGVGAMTAAYWLTNPLPDGTVPDHDITVYQLGWRLGGKGASGRNAAEGQRIEEHGLHIWMGFYANAFRMIRNVYTELDRPAGAPLATWTEAFKPQTVYTMMDKHKGEWMHQEWVIATPIMPGQPGDQTGFGSPCSYHANLVQWAVDRIGAHLDGRETHGGDPPSEEHAGHLRRIHKGLHDAFAHMHPPRERGRREERSDESHHHVLLIFALEVVQKLIGVALDLFGAEIGMSRTLILADVAVATALGILRDLCGNDFESIDDYEWRAWLRKNGMHEQSSWSGIIRALYDIVFAFRDGDSTNPDKADLAAGTTTKTILRINFDYYDGVFMKMQAGMGDTIFGPIYEVLKKRGVKFKYFHRLREVVPSDDGARIEKLRIGVQATVKDGRDYDPLVDVKGLPCWPSTPNYDQLVQGDELRARHIDLEAYDSDWYDVDELELRHGTDFDHVVFGLSLGAVPRVCRRILEQKHEWREMVDHVKVVRTQASQLWFSRNVADLGWPPALDGRCYGERAVFGTYVEPLDTWGDMSQLIPLEDWKVPVKNIAYFCGAMKDSDPVSIDVPREITRELLEQHMSLVWTRAAAGNRFRYDWLVVSDPNAQLSDEERYRRQFFRVNTEPTETYVLSVAGSTKHRLDPARTGYENLSLAGDWVRNGLAIGCVESAVLGGMKGVQRLCPGMVIVE